MADPKLGDLVSCTKQMRCDGMLRDDVGNDVMIARPTNVYLPPGRQVLEADTLGLVVRDHLGASDMLGILIGNNLVAMFPHHLRVVQPFEECHAS